MYVCVCQAVSEKDIQRAVGDGAACFEDLQARTGCTTCCGCCEQEARELLETELESGNRASKHRATPLPAAA